MSRKVGVGVIGCGVIAKNAHLKFYKKNPCVRLVAVADKIEQRAKQAAQEFQVDAYYADYRKLLKREDIEAVSICTPHPTHAEISIEAARAGKHILCEKPLAISTKQADEMVEAANKANVKLMVGYQTRFSPVLQRVKKLIEEGVIGKIYEISKIGGARQWKSDADWFYSKEAGGGVLLDWGTYTAYMFTWLIGKVKSVYALSDTYIKERKSTDRPGQMVRMEVEDTASMLLRFRNGAMGLIYESWSSPIRHDHIEIIGSEGCIMIRSMDAHFPIAVYTMKKTLPDYLEGWNYLLLPEMHSFNNGYEARINHFVKCILQNKEPLVTGRDGREAVEILEAAYRSVKANKPIDLPLEP